MFDLRSWMAVGIYIYFFIFYIFRLFCLCDFHWPWPKGKATGSAANQTNNASPWRMSDMANKISHWGWEREDCFKEFGCVTVNLFLVNKFFISPMFVQVRRVNV